MLATVVLLAVAARGRLAHRGGVIDLRELTLTETAEAPVTASEEPTGV